MSQTTISPHLGPLTYRQRAPIFRGLDLLVAEIFLNASRRCRIPGESQDDQQISR